MNTQSIHAFAITVPDYDDAIDYYCGILGFELIQDTRLTPDKRWVLIRPKARKDPTSFWRAPHPQSKAQALAIKPADGCLYF